MPVASHISNCENYPRANEGLSIGWLSFPYENLEFIKRRPTRYRFGREDASLAARGSCGRCGTQLAYDYADNADADSIDFITVTLYQPDVDPPDT